MTAAVQRSSNSCVGQHTVDDLDDRAATRATRHFACWAAIAGAEVAEASTSIASTLITANLVAANARVTRVALAAHIWVNKGAVHTRQLAGEASVLGSALAQLSGGVADTTQRSVAWRVASAGWDRAVVTNPVAAAGTSLQGRVAVTVAAAVGIHTRAGGNVAKLTRPRVAGSKSVAEAHAVGQSAVVRARLIAGGARKAREAVAESIGRGGAIDTRTIAVRASPAGRAVDASRAVGGVGIANTAVHTIGSARAIRDLTANASPTKIASALGKERVAHTMAAALARTARNLANRACEAKGEVAVARSVDKGAAAKTGQVARLAAPAGEALADARVHWRLDAVDAGGLAAIAHPAA